MTITIEIDGKKIKVEKNTTIIAAADKAGIPIPRFCYHKKLSIAANCRMCLVEVEKFNKPLPACATQVSDGMKVSTKSKIAVEAQQSVMEFLLINHPLDCPICDQGGECELQDTAVAFGGGQTRYKEEKRVVFNKNIGPLISTDMTRCIQCTRCVRFLQEVGGMMELGMVGRGEHSEITAYVDRSIQSELSGNIIDLCPVGALTSKPFRYKARTWELIRRTTFAHHDSLGSPLEAHIKQNKVIRMLPREEESINECWISDRDRFSYEGLNSEDRLQVPMIKEKGEWKESDWETALALVSEKLKHVIDHNGPEELGILISPQSSIEEGLLAKQISSTLKSPHIDHRIRQSDFSINHQGSPWLGGRIDEIGHFDQYLLIGSNIRNEQPLLASRIRKAVNHGANLFIVNSIDADPLMTVSEKMIQAPHKLPYALAKILKSMTEIKGILKKDIKFIKADIEKVKTDKTSDAIAEHLMKNVLAGKKNNTSLLLGQAAQEHPDYATIYQLAFEISKLSQATFALLPSYANSVGLHAINVLPEKDGLNARTMLEKKLKAYILLNIEPQLDASNAQLMENAIVSSDFTVALTSYNSKYLENVDVLLPISPFTESSGTIINIEGRVQSYTAVTQPLGQSRPAWKVLRVLANHLDLKGFDYESSLDVKEARIKSNVQFISKELSNEIDITSDYKIRNTKPKQFSRIGEIHQYLIDPIVRRAPSLQTAIQKSKAHAKLHPLEMKTLRLKANDKIKVMQGNQWASLMVIEDISIPEGSIYIPSGIDETANLADIYGDITVQKIIPRGAS
jgi:NADH-quinone oxidoreductase subunit G